jgi:hypothetical protein
MTLRKAMRTLQKDAEFLGMGFTRYLGTVASNPGIFPQGVLEAYDVFASHSKEEQTEEYAANLGLDLSKEAV